MITPRVRSLRDARADYEELESLSVEDTVPWVGPVNVSLRLYGSPDGEPVFNFVIGTLLGIDAVPLMVERLELAAGMHLVIYAPRYAEGFEEALDAATAGQLKITLLEREPAHPEVEAVPFPDPAPPVTTSLTITEGDFVNLFDSSYRFKFDEWAHALVSTDPQKGSEEDVDSHWLLVYEIDAETPYSHLLLLTAFLRGQGHAYEVASNEHDGSRVVLTDFKTAFWRRSEEMEKVKARLAQEAVEASNDPLVKLYHMDSAEKED